MCAATHPEQHEVGAAREHVERKCRHRGNDAGAFGDDVPDAVVHVVGEPQCEATGDLLDRIEVVRKYDLVEFGDEP